MKITWFGHSPASIETKGVHLLIDPFFTNNPTATITAEEVPADYIILTHGHGDHYGDTDEIAQRTGATVIANYEIATHAQKKGAKVHPMHIGGGFQFPFGRLQLTIAHHGSSFADGSYAGNPAGLLFSMEGKNIYHAGDTGLFYDMKLIGEKGIDVALLPIGDNFTMGPEDALRAVHLIQPKVVIPVHYDTWDIIKQDAEAWAKEVESSCDTKAVVLKPGEVFELA